MTSFSEFLPTSLVTPARNVDENCLLIIYLLIYRDNYVGENKYLSKELNRRTNGQNVGAYPGPRLSDRPSISKRTVSGKCVDTGVKRDVGPLISRCLWDLRRRDRKSECDTSNFSHNLR